MINIASTDGGCHMSELTIDAILNEDDDTISLPRHIRQDCECRIVEAPVDATSEIVENGGVPILNLEPTGTDKLGLVAKPYDGSTKYVIIWHRPDDEFASSQYSTITTCQLIRLADRLGALHMREAGAEICFWMQALCVPYSATNNSEVDNLKEIYSQAYELFIMDSDWLSQPYLKGDEAAYQHITKLKSDFPDLTRGNRIMLIGPLGFHIEVDNSNESATDEELKPQSRQQRDDSS